MQQYKFDLLKLIIDDRKEDEIKFIWEGESITKTPEETIGKVLFELLQKDMANKRIVLDLKGLTFINSATIATIVLFLKELKLKGIKVLIEYNENYPWQVASFKILRNFTNAIEKILKDNGNGEQV